MLEIDIPSIDPIQYEPRVFLGLTSRQIIFGVPGVVLSGLAAYVLYKAKHTDAAVFVCLIILIPFVLLGWYRPYNMKFEDYARLYIWNNFIASPTRILKTDEADELEKHLATLKERKEQEAKAQEAAMDAKKKKNSKKVKLGKK